MRHPGRRANTNPRGRAGVGGRRVRDRFLRRRERLDCAENRFRAQAARLQRLQSLRVELHARESLNAEEVEKSCGCGLHRWQREREADDGDRRCGGEPPLEVGRRRDAHDGVWREGTQRRAQSRCEFRVRLLFQVAQELVVHISVPRWLPVAAQRLHHAMQNRSHVRLAQTRELGDGAIRSFGPVLQRDELLLA